MNDNPSTFKENAKYILIVSILFVVVYVAIYIIFDILKKYNG